MHITSKYQSAIDAFTQSLEINEDWQSYQGLGLAAHKNTQYAIAFEVNKSLALKEDHTSYRGLGWTLLSMTDYKSALSAFSKSLDLKEEGWNSCKEQPSALSKKQDNESKIRAFKKSIELKDNWQSFKGLGLALLHTNQFQLASVAFKKSLSTQPDWHSYKSLASALNQSGKDDKAVRSMELYYGSIETNPYVKIDPYLGEKRGVSVTKDFIENLTSKLSERQIEFHPSFCSEPDEYDEQLLSWKHLIFVHIQKCAGTNFEKPLSELIQYVKDRQKSSPNSSHAKRKTYLWHGNLVDKYAHDAYLSAVFKRQRIENIHGSFLVNHDSPHGHYYQDLLKAGIVARKICLVRDPYRRLYSHVRDLGSKVSSKKE